MSSAVFAASADYYDQIEAAIMESPRGRWFLSEHAKRSRTPDTERILSAIADIAAALRADAPMNHVEILRRELQDMSHSIVQTRLEIAAIKPTDPGNNRIMVATEELDAIVTATERATSDILTAAERLQAVADDLSVTGADGKLCDEVANLATSILMACSFQDITGQRTTKVVHVLRYLEQRVNAMIEIWGIEGIQQKAFDNGDRRTDSHLLNGPPPEGEGIQQDDVDRLLSGQKLDTAPAPMPKPAKTVAAAAPAAMTAGSDAEIDQNEIDRLFG